MTKLAFVLFKASHRSNHCSDYYQYCLKLLFEIYNYVEISTLRWEYPHQCSSNSLESILAHFFLGGEHFTFTSFGIYILLFFSFEYILLFYDIINGLLSHDLTSAKCVFRFRSVLCVCVCVCVCVCALALSHETRNNISCSTICKFLVALGNGIYRCPRPCARVLGQKRQLRS